MAVKARLDLSQWEALQAQLVPLVKRPEKYRLFTLMTRMLATVWWAETFRKQGARRGHEEWVPLSPEYADWKQKNKGHQRALLYSGHLMGSVQVLRKGNDFLEWGTKVPYGRYHQEGVPGRIPKREFVFVTDKDVTEMGKFIGQFIRQWTRSG